APRPGHRRVRAALDGAFTSEVLRPNVVASLAPVRFRLPLALLVLALALVAAGCGSEESAPTTPAATGGETVATDPCAKEQLDTHHNGTLHAINVTHRVTAH